MNPIVEKTDTSSNTTPSTMPSPQLAFSMDSSPFLNWTYNPDESDEDKAVVFRSLVATLKSQDALDDSLEEKAVEFLESVTPDDEEFADLYVDGFASNSDKSLTIFLLSIMFLISSGSQVIKTATMKMLRYLPCNCTPEVRFPLVQADLIPQLINTLNPQDHSFEEAEDLHICLLSIMNATFGLTTPLGLDDLSVVDDIETEDVHEAVLKQALVPSEKYLCHLCMNRHSIIDGDQSSEFMKLLAQLIGLCTHCEFSMNIVRDVPVMLTIPSCLTFFEDERSIGYFLWEMNYSQEACNRERGKMRRMMKTVHRMLRMEGFEDVIEEKLQNDEDESGSDLFAELLKWNNWLGMNIPKQN
ncbi:hypothetical protein BLNAU_21745 [Blattamonas nauphoetae]|uniref:Uncharacterized protein n=1 Tax=Blattamonas nauphoetae TaxID=2049346 RepID=A0ABQ9WV00_9EUKA|nr:hypothetical protein BLNAU_21745 [Blattamonas nauphoetae]